MNYADIIRQPDDLQSRIWRYMDLPKFIYLLEKRKLYLARADRFEDIHEGATPAAQLNLEADESPDMAFSLATFRRRQREWTFISCWSHCDHESHALWRIFCGPKHGVAVCSQYAKLAGFMNLGGEDKMVGLVDYGRDDSIPQNTLVPFFRKRKAFDYESEARFVVNLYRCNDIRNESGELIEPKPCLAPDLRDRDLAAFVDEIRIHPEADSNYVEVVRSVVKKYAPELENRVFPSELAAEPRY